MGRTLRTMAVVAAAALTGAAAGCNPTALMMLTSGDQRRPPELPLPPKGEQKTVTVAIVPSADPGVAGDFVGVQRELATALGRKLAEESKDAKKVKPITVVEQAKVDKYLAAHPEWEVGSPGAVAKPLGADYVLDMRVNKMSMYDQQYGQEAFVGHAVVTVAVYDSADPDRPMRDYVLPVDEQPKGNSGSASQYRQWFIDRVATKLAYKHTPHLTERELGPIK